MREVLFGSTVDSVVSSEDVAVFVVVVAVLALILVGIMVYLYLMDRKLSKLEREVEDQFSTEKE